MGNPWKWTTLGILGLTVVVGTSSLTTAYLLRPATTPTLASTEPERAVEPRTAVARLAPAPRRLARVASIRPARVAPAEVSASVASAPVAAAPVAPAVVTPPIVAAPAPPAPVVVSTPAPAPPPVVAASQLPAAAARPDNCTTGGDRALRIAKPGGIGALLGVGLGAAGGALTGGGSGAGKGAIIGGLAGAAIGAGYGAYKTKTECGTIFGGTSF